MSAALLLAFASAVRVFSADYCADQLTLALADREEIAALSVDAEKDFSYLRDKAKGLPQARAGAEEIFASRADLVLRFWGGDARRLEKLGVKTATLGYAADFGDVKEAITVAARALGEERRGAALNREIDRRLQALAARGPSAVKALYVTPGGVTAGKETMIDAIFRAAGVRNIAAEKGLSYWPALSAEALILDPPPLIVAGFFSSNSERLNHWSAARHPALRKTLDATPRVDLPADIIACPGWFALDAAEAIRNAADRMATR